MEIEYIEDTHQYLVDGVLVPSVTALTNYATGYKYKNVPSDILRNAQKYGTKVHELIESEWHGSVEVPEEYAEAFQMWQEIKQEHNIKVESMETMVFTCDFAGRYDMIAEVDGVRTLIDIKTSSEFPTDHLRVQMALYLRGIGENMPCACVWLPRKKQGGLREVQPITPEKVTQLITCHKTGEVFNLDDLPIELFTPAEVTKLNAFYKMKSEVEEIEARARANAITAMKQNGVKSFENEYFKITYIAESRKRVIDTDRLKEDGLYDKYAKESKSKEGVRITWKAE